MTRIHAWSGVSTRGRRGGQSCAGTGNAGQVYSRPFAVFTVQARGRRIEAISFSAIERRPNPLSLMIPHADICLQRVETRWFPGPGGTDCQRSWRSHAPARPQRPAAGLDRRQGRSSTGSRRRLRWQEGRPCRGRGRHRAEETRRTREETRRIRERNRPPRRRPPSPPPRPTRARSFPAGRSSSAGSRSSCSPRN